jgi:hypothetical protein
MEKSININFFNKEEFTNRYNKIYKMLPYHKYEIQDFERLFTFSFKYKKIDYFLEDLEWDRNLIEIILKISKKFIGIYYEVNKKNPVKKIFLLENKNNFHLYIFHIILLLSNDDISENILIFKINIIQKFFYFYSFNDYDKIKDLENAKKYLLFLISIRENFIGYIFHFYLNLPNLMDIKNIDELLSIKKINGEFDNIYSQSSYFSLFDLNVRNSFKKDNVTIVIDNRDKLFKIIFDLFVRKFDNDTSSNDYNSTKNCLISVNKSKIKSLSLFNFYKKKFSFENLIDLKEFFSPFRITFYLIYGRFYENSDYILSFNSLMK